MHDGTEFIASYHVEKDEEGRELCFFHLDVFYFSASVLKRMMAVWPDVRSQLPAIIFTAADHPSPAWHKLVQRFGFRFLIDADCTDFRSRPIYVHFGGSGGRRK